MTKLELSLEIPDKLAREARREGLLAPDAIKSLLELGVRQKAAERIRLAANKGGVNGEAPMTLDELQAIVDSVRKAKA
ncbi:MAG: hypothetical protein ABIM50_01570 [Novosphingobium sp.]